MTKQFSKNGQLSGVLNVYKRPGETPLECLDRLKKEYPDFAHLPLSYLGRLDPLASGVMVIAVGEENKKRSEYLSLPKEYVVDVLLGMSTDSGDVLGLVTEQTSVYNLPPEEEIKKCISNFVGKRRIPYPEYSSKPVHGKPLFAWARQGNLHDIKIPETELKISSIIYKGLSYIKGQDLKKEIVSTIALVKGDFRQEKITGRWNEFFVRNAQDAYAVISIIVSCESGSYMRSLASEIGTSLGVPALALHIIRTKVGTFTLEDSLKN